jgi:hypothetical protein
MRKAEQILTDIKKYGLRAIGQKELVKHLEGERLSTRQMIIAKCYDCLGYYSDGTGCDCLIPECPLYPLQPYRKGPKYVGKTFSAEAREKMAARGRLISAK